MIYLDTHVLIFLYFGKANKLSRAARKAIEQQDLVVSPAAILELEVLREIGRIEIPESKIIATLSADFGLRVCDIPFRDVVTAAIKEGWARDPFDRLIVANAKAARAPLLTKDERLLEHYTKAIW